MNENDMEAMKFITEIHKLVEVVETPDLELFFDNIIESVKAAKTNSSEILDFIFAFREFEIKERERN